MEHASSKRQSINLYGPEAKKVPFLWTEALRMGHDTIDRQHQKAYEAFLGVRLLLMQADVNVGYWLGMVGRRMDEYVLTHFKEEERFMLVMGYPDLEAHRQQHIQFVDEFYAHKERIKQIKTEAEKREAAYWLLNYLNDWFETDELVYDKSFVIFVNERK